MIWFFDKSRVKEKIDTSSTFNKFEKCLIKLSPSLFPARCRSRTFKVLWWSSRANKIAVMSSSSIRLSERSIIIWVYPLNCLITDAISSICLFYIDWFAKFIFRDFTGSILFSSFTRKSWRSTCCLNSNSLALLASYLYE